MLAGDVKALDGLLAKMLSSSPIRSVNALTKADDVAAHSSKRLRITSSICPTSECALPKLRHSNAGRKCWWIVRRSGVFRRIHLYARLGAG
jgi:hypothetical protein